MTTICIYAVVPSIQPSTAPPRADHAPGFIVLSHQTPEKRSVKTPEVAPHYLGKRRVGAPALLPRGARPSCHQHVGKRSAPNSGGAVYAEKYGPCKRSARLGGNFAICR